LAISLTAPGEVLAQRSDTCTGPTPGAVAKVAGLVLDTSSSTIGGASVTVGCGSTRQTVKTGSDGRFQVEMPPGSYELRVNKSGFGQSAELITLPPGA